MGFKSLLLSSHVLKTFICELDPCTVWQMRFKSSLLLSRVLKMFICELDPRPQRVPSMVLEVQRELGARDSSREQLGAPIWQHFAVAKV